MAEIGDEPVRDVAHRMRDARDPRQRAGVILTHKPRTAGDTGGRTGPEPAPPLAPLNHVLRDPQLAQSAPAAGTIQRQINHWRARGIE